MDINKGDTRNFSTSKMGMVPICCICIKEKKSLMGLSIPDPAIPDPAT